MENLTEKTKEKDLNTKSSKEYFCRVCEFTPENIGELRNHIQLNHPKRSNVMLVMKYLAKIEN